MFFHVLKNDCRIEALQRGSVDKLERALVLYMEVRLVARLDGSSARTGDGELGVKTIWLGMPRLLDFAAGIRFSRELQAQGTCAYDPCVKHEIVQRDQPLFTKGAAWVQTLSTDPMEDCHA